VFKSALGAETAQLRGRDRLNVVVEDDALDDIADIAAVEHMRVNFNRAFERPVPGVNPHRFVPQTGRIFQRMRTIFRLLQSIVRLVQPSLGSLPTGEGYL